MTDLENKSDLFGFPLLGLLVFVGLFLYLCDSVMDVGGLDHGCVICALAHVSLSVVLMY